MRSLLFAVLFAMAAGPALAEDPFPVTVTDGRGANVTLEKSPKKVAALWAAAADMMVALERPVYGVTTYEGAMPVYLGDAMEGAVDFGDITAPNLELMAVSDLDLTIGMTRYNAPYADDIEKFSKFVTYEGFNIEQSLQSMVALGKVLGAEEEAEALNKSFLEGIEELASQTPAEPRSVLFVWSYQNTLYGYQENVLTAELIARLGAVNPLGRNEEAETPDNAFVVLEAEDLLKLNPDVMMFFVSHGGAVPYNPVFERLDAFKNNQIYSVGYQYTQPAGPIARDLVLREAAYLIWPETFAKPDMPEGARAVPLEFAR
ncbi:MAG: ABC transporter substrate-binding protein [Pseudomonadota bacterium]